MGENARISDAEWLVMNVIWEKKKTTSQNIVSELEQKTEWSEKTIKTLIRRLVGKKAVGYEVDAKDRRIYYYFPLIERDQCIRQETQLFLEKFYNGALSTMLSSFVKREDLSAEEMHKLMEFLKNQNNGED